MDEHARTRALTRAATDTDVNAIARIYNQGIAGRMATFETTPRTADDILRTLAAGRGRYPFLVATIDDEVAGWASVSTYRPRECYAGIGEFSIYILSLIHISEPTRPY